MASTFVNGGKPDPRYTMPGTVPGQMPRPQPTPYDQPQFGTMPQPPQMPFGGAQPGQGFGQWGRQQMPGPQADPRIFGRWR